MELKIGNFDIVKGAGKFLVGAVGVAIAFLVANPEVILSIVPKTWIAIGLGGLVVELIDYVKNCLDQING